MEMEYAPIISGSNTVETAPEWYRRESVDTPWEVIPTSEVPAEVIEREVKLAARKSRIRAHGFDPEEPPRPFVVVTRGSG